MVKTRIEPKRAGRLAAADVGQQVTSPVGVRRRCSGLRWQKVATFRWLTSGANDNAGRKLITIYHCHDFYQFSLYAKRIAPLNTGDEQKTSPWQKENKWKYFLLNFFWLRSFKESFLSLEYEFLSFTFRTIRSDILIWGPTKRWLMASHFRFCPVSVSRSYEYKKVKVPEGQRAVIDSV